MVCKHGKPSALHNTCMPGIEEWVRYLSGRVYDTMEGVATISCPEEQTQRLLERYSGVQEMDMEGMVICGLPISILLAPGNPLIYARGCSFVSA